MKKNKIIKHYKSFFGLEDMGMAENDHLMVDWAESLVKDCNLPVSGSFMSVVALERLIKKWNEDAEKIKTLTEVKESKHQREVANHFLIQLYKCIGDAESELKNCR